MQGMAIANISTKPTSKTGSAVGIGLSLCGNATHATTIPAQIIKVIRYPTTVKVRN